MKTWVTNSIFWSPVTGWTGYSHVHQWHSDSTIPESESPSVDRLGGGGGVRSLQQNPVVRNVRAWRQLFMFRIIRHTRVIQMCSSPLTRGRECSSATWCAHSAATELSKLLQRPLISVISLVSPTWARGGQCQDTKQCYVSWENFQFPSRLVVVA